MSRYFGLGGLCLVILSVVLGATHSKASSPDCEVAINFAASRYNDCLLRAYRRHARHGDATKLGTRIERCASSFERRGARVVRRHAEDQCTSASVSIIGAEVVRSAKAVSLESQGIPASETRPVSPWDVIRDPAGLECDQECLSTTGEVILFELDHPTVFQGPVSPFPEASGEGSGTEGAYGHVFQTHRWPPTRPLIFAHKGGDGMVPGNTMPAYRFAARLGVDILDADVHMTRDLEIVIYHDTSIKRERARVQGENNEWKYVEDAADRKNIADYSYEELRRFDVGSEDTYSNLHRSFPARMQLDGVKIPRVEELFAFANQPRNSHLRVNLEIKTSPTDPSRYPVSWREFTSVLCQKVKAAGLEERTDFQSFDWRPLLVVFEECPGSRKAFLTDHTYKAQADGTWQKYFIPSSDTPNESLDFNVWEKPYSEKARDFVDLIVQFIVENEINPSPSREWMVEQQVMWQPILNAAARDFSSENYLADHPSAILYSAADIHYSTDRGIFVLPWTSSDGYQIPHPYNPWFPNQATQVRDALAAGTIGVITNRPDIARGVWAQQNIAMPSAFSPEYLSGRGLDVDSLDAEMIQYPTWLEAPEAQ